MPSILYLHGFLSSPLSAKVDILRRAADGLAEVIAPDLNLPPLEADALIRETLASMDDPVAVVGSSLGGFYAARAATAFDLRGVLLNPCLTPWTFAAQQTGLRQIWGTRRTVEVKASFADDFRVLAERLSPECVSPDKTLVVLTTGDEVLPWRDAAKAYARARQYIVPGSDHRISDFADVVPRVLDFALSGTVNTNESVSKRV